MNESDHVRLRHMLDASREVRDFVKGASRESLDTDLKLVRALSMSIGIIGEAANNVSQEVYEAFRGVARLRCVISCFTLTIRLTQGSLDYSNR